MSLNNPADRFRGVWQSNHWQDWVNVILAIWLFISPWILAFGAGAAPPAGGTAAGGAVPAPLAGNASNASWNAWVLGVIIFIVAASAISRLQVWQEWINLLLGIWLFIAPWVLGFTGLANAAWDHWIVGILVFLLAVWDLNTIRTASTTAGIEPGYAGNKPNRRP